MKEKSPLVRSSVFTHFGLVTLCTFLLVFLIQCKKTDTPAGVIDKLNLQLVADNFVSPIGVVASPDNTKRLFVIDQVGKIWIVDSTGNKLSTPFLDLTASVVPLTATYDERGLLGLAFHPQFATNRRFYVYYQLPPRTGIPPPPGGTTWNNLSRIAEFQASAANNNVADLSTQRTILEMDDAQSNHNGGTIEFGPDGYLYIAIGDGGGADDVGPNHVADWYAPNAGGNGQDIDNNLFGDVLRIDVNNTAVPYSIPADNPFVGTTHKGETWAYGFRNPFRFSFDMAGNRDLILGDAGQALYEEINLVTKGSNYGWNVKEGKICFQAANNDTAFASCPSMDVLNKNLTDPVIILNNKANPAGGNSLTVIGGNVYRGSIPSLYGKYIFGNFSQSQTAPLGELYVATPNGQQTWPMSEMKLEGYPSELNYYVKGFGQDRAGEVYVALTTALGPSGSTGKVFKIVKVP
jgi:glucose/arabinose dehydrogenase